MPVKARVGAVGATTTVDEPERVAVDLTVMFCATLGPLVVLQVSVNADDEIVSVVAYIVPELIASASTAKGSFVKILRIRYVLCDPRLVVGHDFHIDGKLKMREVGQN